MKNFKRIVTLALCIIMIFALTSCHVQTPSVVVNVNGTDISAGIYLMAQFEAYNSAYTAYSNEQYMAGAEADSDINVLTATIEGVSGEEWVKNETDRLLKQYVYATVSMAEGATITPEEIDAARASAITMFDSYYSRELYEANGIGEDSYAEHYVGQTIYYDLIGDYTEENSDDISEEDARAYMDENYRQINTLSLPNSNAENVELDEAGKAEIQAIADALVADLNAGEDLDEIAEDALKAAFEVCGVEYTEEALTQYKTTYYLAEGEVSYYFDYTLVQEVFAMSEGDAGQVVSGNMPLVYSVIPNYTDEAQFNTDFFENMAGLMLQEEFEAQMEEAVAAYTVEEYGSARSAYSPNKIVETV